MEHSEINRQTANATKWSAITEIASKCVAPVTNMILARLLAPEAFGVVATVTMIVSFADMFTDAGFQKYLVQHDFDSREELDQNTNVAFWTNIAISFILWGGIFLFRERIAEMLGNPGLGNVIAVAALSLPLTSFSSIQMARFRREFDFKSLFYVRMISVCIPFLVTIPLALITKSYWALIFGTLAGNMTNAICLTVRSSWKPRLYYKPLLLKKMFSYSWWILMESIANWFSGNIGTFIVSAYLTTYYIGLYKTSMSTVNQIINLITAATSAPLFVAMSKLKSDREVLLDTYYQFIHGLSFFLCPIGVGIYLYRDFVTAVLLGSQWIETADFVGLWGLSSSVVLLLGTYCNGLYNAVGKTKLSFFSQVLHLAALIPTLVWSAPRGFDVLYLTRCAVRLELVAVQMVFMKLFMKVSFQKLLSGLYPAAVCTLLMTAVGMLVRKFGDGFLWSVIGIVICIATYFSVACLLYHKRLIGALALFGIRINKKLNSMNK